ncbi:MAG: hypothetical protein WD314_15040 [Trueperaceae bacterium]
MNEHLVHRLARDRTRELDREAEVVRQLAVLRLGWRSRLARALMNLAARLEPACAPNDRQLARF